MYVMLYLHACVFFHKTFVIFSDTGALEGYSWEIENQVLLHHSLSECLQTVKLRTALLRNLYTSSHISFLVRNFIHLYFLKFCVIILLNMQNAQFCRLDFHHKKEIGHKHRNRDTWFCNFAIDKCIFLDEFSRSIFLTTQNNECEQVFDRTWPAAESNVLSAFHCSLLSYIFLLWKRIGCVARIIMILRMTKGSKICTVAWPEMFMGRRRFIHGQKTMWEIWTLEPPLRQNFTQKTLNILKYFQN